MAVIRYLYDKLSNVVSGLGGQQDKSAATTYAYTYLTDVELLNAYRGAWLPRKIIDIPAKDAVRQWRSWQADENEITRIEGEEKRLGVQGKVHQALTLARLFGGAAIYIGTGETNTARPLDPERIGKGGVKFLTVFRHDQLTPGELDTDPMAPTYNQPRAYQVASGTVTSAIVEIHPSRLILFSGNEHPMPELNTSRQGWADPVLLSVMQAVKNSDSTMANIATMTFDAKVDVYRIPGFMDGMSDPAYEAAVIQRFALANTLKGINHALVLDKEEEYEQKVLSFASLPEIVDRFFQAVSGAADIPLTRLLGQSPGGLSATGESDLRNYYDGVKSDQELRVSPRMMVFDECLIRSATGARRPEIYYEWRPLWQPTAMERATIGKTTAETVKVLADTRLFPEDALSATAANMLTETGVMPGLDAEIGASAMEAPYDREPEEPIDPAAGTSETTPVAE